MEKWIPPSRMRTVYSFHLKVNSTLLGSERLMMVKGKSMWELICFLYMWSPLLSVIGS